MEIDICREYGQVCKIFCYPSSNPFFGAIWKSAASDCSVYLFWVHPLFHVGFWVPLHLFVFTGCGLVALGRGGKGAERQDIAAPPQPCAHPISLLLSIHWYLYFVFLCLCICVFVFLTLQLLVNLVCHTCANVQSTSFERYHANCQSKVQIGIQI